MKRLGLTMIYLFFTVGIFSQVSHIQVVAEAGISIFLDTQFRGVTSSDFGGLIIQNVNPGQHTIKVIKEGYIPQEEIINVKTGEVFTYQVGKNFVPAIKITEQGNKEDQAISVKMGNLKFQSLPINIHINIPKLQINTSKVKDEWLAERIPEGVYETSFNYNGKTLTDNFSIQNEMVTYAFINMVDGKIERRSITPISRSIVNNTPPVIPITPTNNKPRESSIDVGKIIIGALGIVGILAIANAVAKKQ